VESPQEARNARGISRNASLASFIRVSFL